jgi:membrane protein DedA with SNARE-associated domain
MGLDALLQQYGVAAIVAIMLLKSIGLPIPIPGDFIIIATAAWAAQGRFVIWQAFIALLVAMVLGSIVQYWVARGPGRQVFYRYGRYLGLTPRRLDAAASAVRRSGPLGIGISILTPGLRTISVAACGLADIAPLTFVAGMTLGTAAFLGLHFFIGVVGGALLASIGGAVGSIPTPVLIAVVLLAVGLGGWILIRGHGHAAASGETLADAGGAWQEAACPACLLLGATLTGAQRVGAAIVLTQAP